MILTATTLAAIIGLSSAAQSIRGDSPIGQKLLSQARRLDYENNQDWNQEQEEQYQASNLSWVSNYSIKFQGCYKTPQWNEDAGDDNDVKISTLNIVRFRLCPSDMCYANSATGCNQGYGDYVIDMNTYLQAIVDLQYDQCETQNQDCGCYNNGGDDAYGTFEKCVKDCFTNNKMDYCLTYGGWWNDNDNAQDEDNWSLKDMAQCQFSVKNNNGDSYYTGPYCSSDGGSIVMGLFTDDTCSNNADIYGGGKTYTTTTGKTLPYTDTSMINTKECMSCNQISNNGYTQVREGCETLYDQSGKCEQYIEDGTGNNNACQYMEGINVVYKDGGLFAQRPNSAYGVFIGLFGCSFVLLSTYGWYLKNKLDRAKVQLVDE